ncbi:MAG TPA: autotransporter-associated beta strand repeat-containing protein, partial [Verrucomicrobiae bacterium]
PVTVCVTPLVPPASATAFGGALMYAVTNAISVVPPNNLTWRGDGAVNAWNTTTSNWLNGANAALFKNGDVVTFDDTGSASPNVVVASGIIPGAVLFNNTQNYTLGGSGSLSGSGTFTKSGSGTVTVGTTNSGFTGSINQNGGSLLIVSGATLGSGSIALSGGSIFGVLGGGAGSAISGPISVALNDSVTLYSGQLATTFGGALSCPDTTSTLNLSNSVSLSGTSSSQFSGFYGTINIPSGTTLRFSANSSGNSFGSLNPNFIINGTLQPRNAGNSITLGALNGAGQLTGPQTASTGTGNTVYTVGGKNLDAVFNGSVISNASSAGSAICLNKVGTGTQTLNGNNMFTGTNGILAGTLVMNGSNVSALVTVFTNATLSGTGVVSGIVRVNPGGILSPGGKTPGTFSIYGNLTNNGPVLNFDLSPTPTVSNDLLNVYGTLNLTGTQQFNFNLTGGALGAGTYSLIEGATNSVQTSLVLTSSLPANTRQALALVAAPAGNNPAYVRLQVSGSASALLWQGNNGNNWDTSTVNWLNGASADQYYNLDTVTFDDTAATGNINLAELVQPGSLLVNNSSLAYTFSGSGALSGSSALRKSGPGSLSIATINNSYFGSIVVSGGSLGVASGANLGSGPVSLGGGTTLALPGSGNAVGLGNALAIPAAQTAALTSGILSSTLSGNLIAGNPGSTLNLAGAGVSLGATTSAQLDGFPGTIDIPPGTTVRFSANSSGNTFGSFTPTFIIDGTLQPRNAGNTIQLGAFSGSGTLAGAQAASGTGDTAYIVGGNNTDANFSGNISSNTAVAGQVILNKIGSGRLTLNGASTYAGGTTVSAGTLRVLNTTGSGTGSGDLEVFSGATLSGTGILASAVTIDNGGILAAGNPTGTLTISNYLTLNDSSLLPFTLGGTSSSVKVSGDLALTGQLMITNGSGFGPGFYPLFTYGGALNLGHLVLASLPSGFNYSYSLDTNTTGVVTLIVSLPTPPSFGNLSLTGGNLSLSGSNGTPGANYYLLQSSNLINWTFIATNQFDTNGTFNVNLTVPVNPPQNFYRLQL